MYSKPAQKWWSVAKLVCTTLRSTNPTNINSGPVKAPKRTEITKKREISEAILNVFSMHDHLKRGEIIDLLQAEGHEYTLGSIKSSLKYLLLSRKLTKDDKNKYTVIGQEQINSIK